MSLVNIERVELSCYEDVVGRFSFLLHLLPCILFVGAKRNMILLEQRTSLAHDMCLIKSLSLHMQDVRLCASTNSLCLFLQ